MNLFKNIRPSTVTKYCSMVGLYTGVNVALGGSLAPALAVSTLESAAHWSIVKGVKKLAHKVMPNFMRKKMAKLSNRLASKLFELPKPIFVPLNLLLGVDLDMDYSQKGLFNVIDEVVYRWIERNDEFIDENEFKPSNLSFPLDKLKALASQPNETYGDEKNNQFEIDYGKKGAILLRENLEDEEEPQLRARIVNLYQGNKVEFERSHFTRLLSQLK